MKYASETLVVLHQLDDFRLPRFRPAAADEFHYKLVREVMDALEHASDADAHFVKELRDRWGVAHDD